MRSLCYNDNIILNKKKYILIHKINMRSVPHVGQQLIELWIIVKAKETYHIFIRKDLSWCICDMNNNLIKDGVNFLEFLRESNQGKLWGFESYGEKKHKTDNKSEEFKEDS